MLPATSSFPGMASATGSSPGRKPTFFATGGEKGQLKIWQADSGELLLHESAFSLQLPFVTDQASQPACAAKQMCPASTTCVTHCC